MTPSHAGPPAAPQGASPKDDSDSAHASPWGLALFFVYLAIYLGFVLLSAFSPATMEREAVAGVNLAVTYGFVLIAVAIGMAAVYGYMSRTKAASPESETALARKDGAR